MCPALIDYDAFDRLTTYQAWLSGPLINAKVVLKIAPAVDPVYAGTIVIQPLIKRLTDSLPKCFDLILVQAVAAAQWMEPCQVQCFVGVDVS